MNFSGYTLFSLYKFIFVTFRDVFIVCSFINYIWKLKLQWLIIIAVSLLGTSSFFEDTFHKKWKAVFKLSIYFSSFFNYLFFIMRCKKYSIFKLSLIHHILVSCESIFNYFLVCLHISLSKNY